MPLIGSCTSNLLATVALVTLLLAPMPFLKPQRLEAPAAVEPPVPSGGTAPPKLPSDVAMSASVAALAGLAALAEWAQRRLLERRLVGLHSHLAEGVRRLHAWDEQQQQLEATLAMVQAATTEYNLLWYLLLRHHAISDADKSSPFSHYLATAPNGDT